MQVSTGSALFSAIATGVSHAVHAEAPPKAIRGVVVLAGGPATTGASLSDVVELASRQGSLVTTCPALQQGTQCIDATGENVDLGRPRGVRLKGENVGAVKVYFIGIGMSDADLNIGRILAEATGSNFVGTTPDNLATVIDVFKDYF